VTTGEENKKFKIEGGVLKKWDEKYQKWNNCGTFENEGGTLYYVTRKREVLHMHNSLGVSKDILQYLTTLNEQPVIKFLLGQTKPYDVYVIPLKVLLEQGIPVPCGNDKEITLHLPLNKLICRRRQRMLGE
jgi:hypothetical protein